MRKLFTLSVAAAVAGLVSGPARAQDREHPEFDIAHVSVSAPAGMDASGVVEGGIPLPETSNVTDVESLSLATKLPDGRWEYVPVQWSVLSRWHGGVKDATKAIKWALARFRGAPGARYWVRYAPNNRGGAPALASEDADFVSVDTGAIRFRIPKKGFAPLGGLRSLVRDAKGQVSELQMVADAGLDATLVSVEQPDPTSAATIERTWKLSESDIKLVGIEENGPIRTIVKVQGQFGREKALLKGFINYTLRIEADQGADSVRLLFTLENNGVYGPPAEMSIRASEPKWLHIRKLDLELPTTLTQGARASTADGTFDLRQAAQGDEFRLFQGHTFKEGIEARNWPGIADESLNFWYTVSAVPKDPTKDRIDLFRRWDGVSGRFDQGRSDGGVMFDDGTRAVTADVRHFWQNYPKATSWDDGLLRFELWPQEKGWKWPNDLEAMWGDSYQFEGGRHKTYEILLTFGGDRSNPPQAVVSREKAFQRPPALVVDPTWISATRAVGPLAVPEIPVRNTALTEGVRKFNQMQWAYVDVNYAEPQGSANELRPCSLVTMRETRGQPFPAVDYKLDCYGWMNFGDLPHDHGYCSGHFDWIHGLFQNWMRFGKREFFDYGVEMLRHRYDIDQYHCIEQADPNWKFYNGLQRFDVGRHGSRAYPEWTPAPQNTWIDGLLLAYALTGDQKAMDAARENADAYANYYEVSGEVDPNIRRPADYYGLITQMANAMDQLLSFWEFTGEEKYFDWAQKIFVYGILYAEEACGQNGFFTPTDAKHLRSSFPIVRLVNPLIHMHRLTNDPRALGLLLRCLTWMKEDGYYGTGVLRHDGWYMPLQLPYVWAAPREQKEVRQVEEWFLPYNYMTCDAFAYAYLATKEPMYLEWARALFRDAVLFFQAPVHQFVPPEFYSPVTYSPRQYPNSETKANAWAMNGMQWYLAIEQMISVVDPATILLPNEKFFQARHIAMKAKVGGPLMTAPTGNPQGGVAIPVHPSMPPAPQSTMPRPTPVQPVPAIPSNVAAPPPPPPPGAPAAAPSASANSPTQLKSWNPPAGGALVSNDPPPAPSSPAAAPAASKPTTPAPTQTPTPAEQVANPGQTLILDDANAVFDGGWTVLDPKDGHQGRVHVCCLAGEATRFDKPATATFTARLTAAGRYNVYAWWGSVEGASVGTRVQVRDATDVALYRIDQKKKEDLGRWRWLGEFVGSPNTPFVITVSNDKAAGIVVADAFKLEPVR